jgi:hypothetical protein
MKVRRFLHAAFRHFGDVWVWEDGGSGSGVGGILESLDTHGSNFDDVMHQLAAYMNDRSAVELYSLRDGQRHPEIWALTSEGKVVLGAGSESAMSHVRCQREHKFTIIANLAGAETSGVKPVRTFANPIGVLMKAQRISTVAGVDGAPLRRSHSQQRPFAVDDAEEARHVLDGAPHPWKSTTLFRFRFWWCGVPPELRAHFASRERLFEPCFLDNWTAYMQLPLRPFLQQDFVSKCLTGCQARGIGEYNAKFLFSDAYVMGNRAAAHACLYTPVGPTGATAGLGLIVPNWAKFQPRRGAGSRMNPKVRAIRYVAAIANEMLRQTAPENRLRAAIKPLLVTEGGPIPAQDFPVDDLVPEAQSPWWLHCYDVQVALCEVKRWLTGGGSGNRTSPHEHFRNSHSL